MNCNTYLLHHFIDMGSLIGTILGTIANDKKNRYVQCPGALKKADIDTSSYSYIPLP